MLLTVTLTCAAPPAFPAPKNRAEAVAALKQSSVASRAEAVAWIALHGRMADQPLLLARLRDDDGSLADCDEVLRRNPEHFGILSGYGQIHFRLEQYERAIDYWRRALRINPNLQGLETNIEGAEVLLRERTT